MKYSPRVYFFGGYYFDEKKMEDNTFNDLFVLNLKHMVFEELSAKNPPRKRFHHTATIVDWQMYLFGGCFIREDNSR